MFTVLQGPLLLIVVKAVNFVICHMNLTVFPYLFDSLQQPIDHNNMANSHSSTIHKEDGYSLQFACS